MKINCQFDCTQRELVVDIATWIYRTHGSEIKNRGLMYLFESEHPTEKGVLAAAEEIFEMFYGDSPNYDDEEFNDLNG